MPAASRAPSRTPFPAGLSVGIPGVVTMLGLAHEKYGKLPWAKLFEPAIKLADDGFPVGPKLARTIKSFTRGASMPDIKAHFYHPDGTPLAEGEIYKNPEYAATLRKIAEEGPDGFLQRRDRAGDRRCGAACAAPAGRHDVGRPAELPGQGARAGLRRLSRISSLLDGPALVRRHRRAADLGHAAAISLPTSSRPTR